MKKGIGYIFWGIDDGLDKKAFEKMAKKKNIEFVTFNLSDDIDEKEIEEKAKRCNIVFNNSGEEFAIELVKTLEELGTKVVDSSEAFYYPEDKWIFFLRCKENNLPTLDTILLSENFNLIKKELKKFNYWPVILKRVRGCSGEYVEKADNPKEALKIIKNFWKNGNERIPIIAQEFVSSPSYRVTVVGDKIVQTAIKESTGWKHTGISSERFRKLKIDKTLQNLIKKTIKIMRINVCGIDLLKKEDKWVLLEVNSSPGIGFFSNAREKLASEILDFLVKKINKKINK